MVAVKLLAPQCKRWVELGMKGIDMIYLQRTKVLLVLFQIIMERGQDSFDLLAFAVRCVMNFLSIIKIVLIDLRQVVLNAGDRFGDPLLSIKIPGQSPDGGSMAFFMGLDEPVQRIQGKDFINSISFTADKRDKLHQCSLVVDISLVCCNGFQPSIEDNPTRLALKILGSLQFVFCWIGFVSWPPYSSTPCTIAGHLILICHRFWRQSEYLEQAAVKSDQILFDQSIPGGNIFVQVELQKCADPVIAVI